MKEETDFVFLKTPRGIWYRIPSDYEPLFNQLLEESILSESSTKFLREFKEFKSISPSEFRKLNKK